MVITVLIHEDEAQGSRQLSFDNPDIAHGITVLYHSYNTEANWFPGNNKK